MNNIKEKIREWLLPSEEDKKVIESPRFRTTNNDKNREVPLPDRYSVKKAPRIFVVFHYLEVQEIANALIYKQNVIVNVSNLDNKQKYRVIDFISGVVYVLNGVRQKLDANIYLFSLESKSKSI